ncbi:MAG: transposase [Thermodesulfobacteriota bacterium]|jgi:transposase-like protein
MRYSKTFKAKMVQKLADPRGLTAGELAQEVGVHQTTLSRWLREAGRVADRDICSFPTIPGDP